MSDRTLPTFDLKCGCGAYLLIERVTSSSIWDLDKLSQIVLAWIAAHKAHHVEPKGKQ